MGKDPARSLPRDPVPAAGRSQSLQDRGWPESRVGSSPPAQGRRGPSQWRANRGHWASGAEAQDARHPRVGSLTPGLVIRGQTAQEALHLRTDPGTRLPGEREMGTPCGVVVMRGEAVQASPFSEHPLQPALCALMQHLLCAGLGPVSCSSSFNPQNNPVGQACSWTSLYRGGDSGTERLTSLPRDTQQGALPFWVLPPPCRPL